MTNEEQLEIGEQDPDALTRRGFLQALSASFAALAASGCNLRPPQEKIIPLVEQPEDVFAGKARWYASTCGGCEASCGVLVKSRDGRPIKLEGNPDHPMSRGGLCARGQATVLDLYDSQRLKQPLADGAPASWKAVDEAIAAGLSRAASARRAIRLVSHCLPSPSLRDAVAKLLKRYPTARHVVYDPLSASSILEAHRLTHGRAVLPHYRFERARAIVAFDADFLGAWISPVEFTKAWASNRRPGSGLETMSWHAQFEPRMSVTGAAADLRVLVRPSEEPGAALALGRLIAKGSGWKGPLPPAQPSQVDEGLLRQAAEKLLAARKRGLVVSGSSEVAVQLAVNWINEMLGNYGETVDVSHPSRQRQGEAGAMEGLIRELEGGKVGALIVIEANPAQDQALGVEFAVAMRKAALTVALAPKRDETASLARFVCATPHALESWGDAEPAAGVASLFQPLLSPLFDTRPALESLLSWAGQAESAYDFIKERWRIEVFSRQKEFEAFGVFWDEALRKGAVSMSVAALPAAGFKMPELPRPKGSPAGGGAFELAAFAGIALADGRQANNPWLQELPDPITKVSWGNVASFAPADAERLGLAEGRMVRLSAGGRAIELPVVAQQGQAPGVVAVALGYGRTAAGPVAANFPTVKLLPIDREEGGGADAYPLCGQGPVSVTALGATVALAKTQIFDSLHVPFTGETRPALKQLTLHEFLKAPEAETGEHEAAESGLWSKEQYTGHKWGMAVNLSSCTGCSACVVACQAENNVPIVGKAEVRKGREMHWIRIDRYFMETEAAAAPTQAAASPDAAFQPMFCQQCDNAPCETVCPVLATLHSTEGLNMQVYNRCVGTRYCANNCPYKARRFSWFDYAHEDLLQNMALNPDVTVRTRGVMEKCTFCVQRIYSAKFEADAEDRTLKDGDIAPACAQSCPAEAIVFGDLNDPDSRVAKLARENRSYRVLAELGVGPAVFYRPKVRNRGS